ncbi:MAG: lipase family protein [Pelosinus sp.]|nr:lipase family protein [Pelosinus sp.]
MGSKLRLICSWLIIMLALPAALAWAEPLSEYKEARNMYIFAAACRASYDDLIGHMAVAALRSQGWNVEKFFKSNKNANARFLLAVKAQPETNEPMYLIAVSGTETLKDVIADFSFNKVNFFGSTLAELKKNASSKVTSQQVPLVHWGFFQYALAAWDIDTQDKKIDASHQLIEELMEKHQRKVYMVGHSLGGAVVTVGAAGMLNVGIDSSRIEVVTFGAPAVGNAAFRREFEPKMHLTRVVMHGDPITRVLQDAVGGYEQFGKQVNWNTDKAFGQAHDMALYLDVAMKNYYEKRRTAQKTGVVSLPQKALPNAGEKFVYVLPLQNHLPPELQNEFSYMEEAIKDTYRDRMPGFYLAEKGLGRQADLKAAAALQCQLVAVPKVRAYKLKNESEGYIIVLEQNIYQASNGNFVGMQTFSSSTRNMTPLESFVHNTVNLGEQSSEWLSK